MKEEDPDILCIQETKANGYSIDMEGYEQYWNSAEKKGYSGTAVFCKKAPTKATYGLGIEEHDREGRVITLEFEEFFIVNVYTPNSQRKLTRLDYRAAWNREFLKYVKRLEKKKPVVFCGDLNVAHKEIDLANPKSNKTTKTKPGNAGFTDAERAGFDDILSAGFIDTFRHKYPDQIAYTWWSYMFNARVKNVGWRIDYFCISPGLLPKLNDAFIRSEVIGSDHCPVGIDISI